MGNVVQPQDLPALLADFALRIQHLEALAGVFTRAESVTKTTDGSGKITYTLTDSFPNTGLAAVVGLGMNSGGVYFIYDVNITATTLSFFVANSVGAVAINTAVAFRYVAVGN